MTGHDEGQWMRERFDLGMAEVPDTPAPHQTIVTRGRARRRRRAVVAGTAATVMVAAGLVSALTLPGGDDQTSDAALPTGSPTAVSAPPTTTPTGSPSSDPAGLGRVTVSSGKLAGHQWQLVRERVHGEYTEESYSKPGEPARPPEKRVGYCEKYELVIDGTMVSKDGGFGCGPEPTWEPAGFIPGKLDFNTVEADDKPAHTDLGIGVLGAISWGFLTPDVDHVRVTFRDTGEQIDLSPQRAPGLTEPFYLLVVPQSTGYNRSADLVAYNAKGQQVAKILNQTVSGD